MATFMRYVFSYCIYAVTIFISWSIVAIIQGVQYITVKPFSLSLYNNINYYLIYAINCQMDFLVTWYSTSEIDIYFKTKDLKYLGKEHACIVSNHFYEIDWLLFVSVAFESQIAGNFKSYIKKSILYVPFIGATFFFSDHILLARSFDKDKKTIQTKLAELMEYSNPIWIFLYPEGTRFTTKRHEESLKFAKEKGLPLLKYHLTPKPKGFLISLPIFQGKLGAVYDAVWSFDPKDEIKPKVMNILLGKKVKAKLYLNRIPMEEIPQDENEATTFLNNLYIEKDKVQDHFFHTGNYFHNSEGENFTKFRVKKKYPTLFVTIAWMVLIMPPFWYFVLTSFFSSIYHAGFISIAALLIFMGFQKSMMSVVRSEKKIEYSIYTFVNC